MLRDWNSCTSSYSVVDCDNDADSESRDVIVLDDEDDAASNGAVVSMAQRLTSNLPLNYSPQAANVALTLPTAAAFPSSAAPMMISPSVVPEMIFTLQNGSAVLMRPPTAFIAGAAYTPTMRLVSPVALAANAVSMPVPTQVSLTEFT